MKNLILVIASGIFWLSACKPTKKIQTALPQTDTSVVVKMSDPSVDSALLKRNILARIQSNKIAAEHFYAKIKLDFSDERGKNTDATAFIRMRKDSVIWISLTGPLGIEGFRILVKPDSVIIMNKQDKEVQYRSVAYLQELVKLPIDFKSFQDLLLGNPVFVPENIVSFRTSGSSLLALGIGEYFKHLITIDTTDNRITNSKLDDLVETRNRTCNIVMGDYERSQGRLFSKNRLISISEKNNISLKLDFKQFEFDKPQSFPFSIPKNYEVK